MHAGADLFFVPMRASRIGQAMIRVLLAPPVRRQVLKPAMEPAIT